MAYPYTQLSVRNVRILLLGMSRAIRIFVPLCNIKSFLLSTDEGVAPPTKARRRGDTLLADTCTITYAFFVLLFLNLMRASMRRGEARIRKARLEASLSWDNSSFGFVNELLTCSIFYCSLTSSALSKEKPRQMMRSCYAIWFDDDSLLEGRPSLHDGPFLKWHTTKVPPCGGWVNENLPCLSHC